MINFTFVIPHKNSPQYLTRCINTIPIRDDVQIIIVDDNSKDELKPRIHRKDTIVIFNKDNLGAGHARNIGLQYAVGKWCFFADCDDFYSNGFLDVLVKSINSDYDIVYFSSFFRIDIETRRCQEFHYDELYEEYCNNPSRKMATSLKFAINAPWNKMYKTSFLQKNNLTFEEIPIGNDALFVSTASYLTKKVCFLGDKLYYYVDNPCGITRKKNRPLQDLIIVFKSAARVDIIKAKAHAWDSIRPIDYNRFLYYSKNYGLVNALSLYCLKFCYKGYPFFRIIINKLIQKISIWK